MTYTAIDCQGFAGGFTLGMAQAGFELVGKREMKGGFGVANCEANRHLLPGPWHSEAVDPAQWSVRPADVVFGNPPCSGFSVMSAKTFRGAGSKINHCMWAFVEYAARVMPTIAVFESVQIARTSSDGLELMRALRTDLEERTGVQWSLHHVRHNAVQLGGAAERRRYFWVVSRVPFGIEWQDIPLKATLRDVIGDLETAEFQWEEQPYTSPATWWSEPRRNPAGTFDGHVGLNNPLIRRVHELIQGGIPWPPGKAMTDIARQYYAKYGELPPSWKHMQEKVLANDFNLGFIQPTRWSGDRNAFVITGGSMHIILHYAQDRMFTHREVARILGFPDDWHINSIKHIAGLQMTWGKGITVDCGRWIGGWIKKALDGNPGSYQGELIGEREFDIDVTHGARTLGRLHRNDIPSGSRAGTMTSTRPVRVTSTSRQERTMTDSQRGRPRPTGTIERDQRVHKHLATVDAGLTRAELAEQTGISGNEIYLSLWRLRSAGLVEKRGGNRWFSIGEPAADAPAEAASTPEPVVAPSPVEQPSTVGSPLFEAGSPLPPPPAI